MLKSDRLPTFRLLVKTSPTAAEFMPVHDASAVIARRVCDIVVIQMSPVWHAGVTDDPLRPRLFDVAILQQKAVIRTDGVMRIDRQQRLMPRKIVPRANRIRVAVLDGNGGLVVGVDDRCFA